MFIGFFLIVLYNLHYLMPRIKVIILFHVINEYSTCNYHLFDFNNNNLGKYGSK